MSTKPVANVYIDGFNLYNGAIKGTNHHWLDLLSLCRLLLPDVNVRHVHYFTAMVSDRLDDPQKTLRQMTYLRALRTFKEVRVTLGQFTTHKKFMPFANPLTSVRPVAKFAQVLRTEEKGSDVNLATWLLHDAHMHRFDVAAVVSNDSDLLAPISVVREVLKKRVGVINPHRHPSKELIKNSDFVRQIRDGPLDACRLPDELRDAKGAIRCPERWRKA